MEKLGVQKRSRLAADLTPRFAPGGYIPHVPHPPQQAFLLLNHVPEVFYGGAAGGGKSDAVLMAALQYVDVPDYSALIIRRTYEDLALPGAIMDRATDWLSRTDAHKLDKGKLWEFPTNGNPATLRFGYAQSFADIYRYQSAEFQYIGFDELTHFEERTYRYMFSRLRGPALPCVNCGHGTSQPAGEFRQHDEDHDYCECGHEHEPRYRCGEPDIVTGDVCSCEEYRPVGCPCVDPEPDRTMLAASDDGTTLADVPLRQRSGSNPGGVGHQWVRSRFVDPETRAPKALFVPAKLRDNPSLDRKAYRASLQHLTLVERQRLEAGDWDAVDEGTVFQRTWFRIIDECPSDLRWVRYWDMAATAVRGSGPSAQKKKHDPDWTVGALVGISDQGQWFIRNIHRFRKSSFETSKEMEQTAKLDGRRIMIRWEEEGGASGKNDSDTKRRGIFVGYDADGLRPTLSKEERARPVATAAQAGNVFILDAPWNREFLDEVAAFPTDGIHDDQIDAVSGAFDALLNARRARIIA